MTSLRRCESDGWRTADQMALLRIGMIEGDAIGAGGQVIVNPLLFSGASVCGTQSQKNINSFAYVHCHPASDS
ncbi:MAG: hypothetical protein GY832_15810 [Chloroflexi bacterium]|nr:hypothetical protein [Chloroflexota bacterium]